MPIGVSFSKKNNKYCSQCGDGFGRNVFLGRFIIPKDAFLVYKAFKEKTIKNVANHYKGQIPEILYKALMSYEVDIDD